MSNTLTARLSPALLTIVCMLALLVAACAPAATPTPTAAPTSAPTAVPTEEAAEPTEEMVEAEPTEAVMEETEAADMEMEATETGDMDMEATETADMEATEAAALDADATEAASAETGDFAGMPGVVGVTSTRVRETPAVRGTVLIEIPLDTPVIALGQTANEGYLFIRLEDGTEGWVSKQTVNLEDRFAALPVIDPES